MPQHIGIVACSAEGAALCYRTICVEGAQFLGPHAHPEVSMHTPSLADYVVCLERDDWPGVGELMLASARKLAAIGADFLICPDNTIHQALPLFRSRSPLPWLHIADAVAEQAEAKGLRRLGLLGTRWLVDGDVYPAKLGAARYAAEAEARKSAASSWKNWCVAYSSRRHRIPPGRHRAHEGGRVRCGRARLHRDPADHQRQQLGVANAGFHAAAGTRRATPRV